MSIRIAVTRAAAPAALVAAMLAVTVPIAYAHQGHGAYDAARRASKEKSDAH